MEKSEELKALEMESVLMPLAFLGLFVGAVLFMLTMATMGQVWNF
jgi:hypothetical protein